MSKIAIVTAFSESCIPILRQCLVSCYQCIQKGSEHSYSIFAYTYNWEGLVDPFYDGVRRTVEIRPFSKCYNLSDDLILPGISIHQLDAMLIDRSGSLLPDIQVYHDFATHHLEQFDYVLFCHDDIVFNESIPIFEQMIRIVADPACAFIGEPHVECLETISIRIYPHFIFTASSIFRSLNLSFINEYRIFENGLRARPPSNDGGAGLLASLYHSPATTLLTEPRPAPVYRQWFKHLRLYTDMGVESYNICHPNSPMFLQLIKEAERYVDSRMYTS